VQVYNVCGFYTVLVPSYFYKALVAAGEDHQSGSAASGSDPGGLSHRR
jgi:hypothetical protein